MALSDPKYFTWPNVHDDKPDAQEKGWLDFSSSSLFLLAQACPCAHHGMWGKDQSKPQLFHAMPLPPSNSALPPISIMIKVFSTFFQLWGIPGLQVLATLTKTYNNTPARKQSVWCTSNIKMLVSSTVVTVDSRTKRWSHPPFPKSWLTFTYLCDGVRPVVSQLQATVLHTHIQKGDHKSPFTPKCEALTENTSKRFSTVLGK